MPKKWGDWRQILSTFVVPCLANHHQDVRMMATEVIGALYKVHGKEVYEEVLSSAQQLKIKPATLDSVYLIFKDEKSIQKPGGSRKKS